MMVYNSDPYWDDNGPKIALDVEELLHLEN